MTESEKVEKFTGLCRKLSKADLRHPERNEQDFKAAIELLGEVVQQQQREIDRLQALVAKTGR